MEEVNQEVSDIIDEVYYIIENNNKYKDIEYLLDNIESALEVKFTATPNIIPSGSANITTEQSFRVSMFVNTEGILYEYLLNDPEVDYYKDGSYGRVDRDKSTLHRCINTNKMMPMHEFNSFDELNSYFSYNVDLMMDIYIYQDKEVDCEFITDFLLSSITLKNSYFSDIGFIFGKNEEFGIYGFDLFCKNNLREYHDYTIVDIYDEELFGKL